MQIKLFASLKFLFGCFKAVYKDEQDVQMAVFPYTDYVMFFRRTTSAKNSSISVGCQSYDRVLENLILAKISIKFFINSGSHLTQTQVLTLNLTPT